MNVKHAPIFDTEKVEKLYSEKDGVPVKYVCTTDLSVSDSPTDVFYRETPHPEFGNRYFGLFRTREGNPMITSADKVEDFDFGMIEDRDGWMWYSQCHHDCIFLDGKMIDGGRQYIRSTGDHVVFGIKDGKFFQKS